MNQPLTTGILAMMALIAVIVWVAEIWRVHDSATGGNAARLARISVAVLVGALAAMLIYRGLWVHGHWLLLQSHLDGLLLVAMLLTGAIVLSQTQARLFGFAAFGLPLLELVLVWSVCASAWTYRPFASAGWSPVWQLLHLTGVYIGTACAAIAAVAGGMYLFVQRRLKRKVGPDSRLASLETLEGVIIRTAAAGFVLLSLGAASGVFLLPEGPIDEVPRWQSPQLLLAVVAWVMYALIINVRRATRLRGVRAAWLAIGGFFLLLTIYGFATAQEAGIN